jgi:cell division protein FtsL
MRRFQIPIWVIPVILLLSVGTVWVRLSIVQFSYEINLTDRELNQTISRVEKLKVEVSQLRSPSRLEILAREEFGLRPPRIEQIVHLKDPQ